jgi:hypothetical protein
VVETPPTREQLHERILSRLPGPEARIFKPLLNAYPQSMSMEDLAAAANYSAGGSAFQNPRSHLRSLGLIDYPSAGQVRARDFLFPE